MDDAELTLTLPVERTIENRYRLERLIGKGGMGAVYEATDSRLNRTVAVKVLSGAMFGNRAALRRFDAKRKPPHAFLILQSSPYTITARSRPKALF